MSAPRRSTAGAAAAGALLLVAAPAPAAAVRTLRTAGTAVDPVAPLVAAATLLAWALVLWLTAVTALTLAGRAPGTLGRVCRAANRGLAPAAVRRAVAAALGLSLAVGVAGAGPAAAGTGSTGSSVAAPAAAGAAGALDRAAAAGPSLDWAAAPAPTGSLDWPSVPAPGGAPEAAAPTAAGTAASPVVVRPGDTLWSLAERDLRGAGTRVPTTGEVAQAWPAWWSANRGVVGDDPDLLLPGSTLTPPSDTTAIPTVDSRGGADGAGPAS